MNHRSGPLSGTPADWGTLQPMALPKTRALRRRLVSAGPPDARNAGFDVLRTRVLGVAAEQGWRRVGIVQPAARPVAAFTALNLALSVARRPSMTVLLADLDLAHPRLAVSLGAASAPRLGQALRDGADLRPAMRRIGANLAVLTNAVPEALASETLQEPGCAYALDRLIAGLAPDLVLLLLPPLLEGDAGIAGLRLVEAGLMVLDGQDTTPAQVRECERLDDNETPMIGLFLAEAEA